MKVDFLITELNVGGAEKMLTELAIGMQRRGHAVRVLSIGSEPTRQRHRLVDQLDTNNVAVMYGGFDHWRRAVAATRWLSQQMRSEPADIHQSFLFHANCLGTFAARRAGTGPFVGGMRVAESNRLRVWLEKKAIRRMNHLVCVSDQVRDFAIHQMSVDPQMCSVIPNSVDVKVYRDAAAFDWSTIGWPATSKVALFVGRFHPQKGIELLQQQFDQMIASDRNRRLLIVGYGPLRESLERWVNDVGQQHAKILPLQRDVAPLMNAAEMLVLPSHYEGMPNVVLEAMAAGRPVVCSRVEGSRELLGAEDSDRNRRQGFEPRNGPAMTKLADQFFRDPGLRESIGLANRQHVQSKFSVEKMVDRYEALYETLV